MPTVTGGVSSGDLAPRLTAGPSSSQGGAMSKQRTTVQRVSFGVGVAIGIAGLLLLVALALGLLWWAVTSVWSAALG